MKRRSFLLGAIPVLLTACVTGDDLEKQDSASAEETQVEQKPIDIIYGELNSMHEAIYNASEQDVTSAKSLIYMELNKYGLNETDDVDAFLRSLVSDELSKIRKSIESVELASLSWYSLANTTDIQFIYMMNTIAQYEWRIKVQGSDYIIRDFRADDYTVVQYDEDKSPGQLTLIKPCADLYQVSNKDRKAGVVDPAKRLSAEWTRANDKWVIDGVAQYKMLTSVIPTDDEE